MRLHNRSSDPLVRFGVLFLLVGSPLALFANRGMQQPSIEQGFHWVDPEGRGSIRLGFTDHGPELVLVAPEGNQELTLGFRADENSRSGKDVAAFVRATSRGSDGEQASGEMLVSRAKGVLVFSQYDKEHATSGAALLGISNDADSSEAISASLVLHTMSKEAESAVKAMATPEEVTMVGELEELRRVGFTASGPVSAQAGIFPAPTDFSWLEAPHAYLETGEEGAALELGSRTGRKRVTADD